MNKRRRTAELLEGSHGWPKAAVTHLPKSRRDAYQRNEDIFLALRDTRASVATVAETYKVSRDEIYRLIDRATTKHPDGRLWGWRGLVPYTQVEPYSRRKDLPAKNGTRAKAGYAGAFGKLLETFESLQAWIEVNLFRKGADGKFIRKVSVKKLHRQFLDEVRRLFREKQLNTADHYPFNQRTTAFRSLSAYVSKLEEKNAVQVLEWNSPALAALYARRTVDGKQLVATRPYEIVQADGHELKVEARLTIKRPDGTKCELVVPRLWLIVFLDVFSRAILGYVLVPYENYNASDVLSAAAAALYGRPERFQAIEGSRYPGKSLPVEFEPKLAGASWDILSLDNALAHMAKDVSEKMTGIVNCAVCRGMPGVPEFRNYIERAFKTIQESGGLAQLAASRYGGRQVKAGTALNIEFILPLIDGLVWEYNFDKPTEANYGRIPNEALLEARDDPFLKKVGAKHFGRSEFTTRKIIKRVRGSVEEGRPPYVEFEGARYAGKPLLENPKLIGDEVIFEYDEDDVLWATIYSLKGHELGRVKATGTRWGRRSHSLRLRRHILQLIRDSLLKVPEGVDFITAWEQFVRNASKPLSTRARAAATERELRGNNKAGPPTQERISPESLARDQAPKAKPALEQARPTSGFKPVPTTRKGYAL